MFKPTHILPLKFTLLWPLLGLALTARAEDWPQWRGPHRDGKSAETGLLKTWPAGGPPRVWKTTGLGAGYATVAVAKGVLYTAGDLGEDNYVLAFREQDGQPLWKARLGKAGAPGWGGFAGVRGTPTVDGDLVFAIGQYGEIAAFEAATGKELWRRDFIQDYGGKLPEWGFSESPLVDGDKLIFTPGGEKGAVVAVHKRTGALLWQTADFTDEAQYASLVPATLAGAPQYVQLTMASVVGISPEGRVLWRAPRKGATAVIPTPVVAEDLDLVYVTSGYNIGCNLFKVARHGDTFTATEVYKNRVLINHHGGVIRVGDHLYGHDDRRGWTCQNLRTGEAVWQHEDGPGKGSCVYADGHLVLREEKKKGSRIFLIEASPAGYKEKGVFEQPDQSGKEAWPHPVIANGRLYLRDQDVLLCYDLRAR
jgi:outer membrane protein assembly factor BamB